MSLKAILLRFALPVCVLCFSGSCKKSDSEPERTNFMEARINGALWNPGSVTCILLTNATYQYRLLSFSAVSTGKTITMEASDGATGNSIATGTRQFTDGNVFFGYSFTDIPYHTVSGSLNVTAVDPSSKWVSGTFEFVVEDNDGNRVEVKGGKFVRLKYIVINQ